MLVNYWRVIDSLGGAEKVFFNMANELVNRGYEVVAVGMEDKVGKPFFHVDDRVKFINAGSGLDKKGLIHILKIALTFSKRLRHAIDKKCLNSKRAERLKTVIDEEKPNIIISYNTPATNSIINYIDDKIKVITMLHHDFDSVINGSDHEEIQALFKSRFVQALTQLDVKKVETYAKSINKDINVVYIPNIVNQVDMNPNRRNVIINVGRLTKEQKQQHLLIEAFNKIKDRCSGWTVEVWGENFNDDYFEECKSLIKKYQLENKVFLCGTTNNVLEKLSYSKIFAFPSAFEGFPLAMTEAMAAGLPVVAYKSCVANNEIIRNGETGYSCKDGIDDFADKLLLLINNESLREKMGNQAKADMKQYAPKEIWDIWENLINTVANEN